MVLASDALYIETLTVDYGRYEPDPDCTSHSACPHPKRPDAYAACTQTTLALHRASDFLAVAYIIVYMYSSGSELIIQC